MFANVVALINFQIVPLKHDFFSRSHSFLIECWIDLHRANVDRVGQQKKKNTHHLFTLKCRQIAILDLDYKFVQCIELMAVVEVQKIFIYSTSWRRNV